LEPAAFLSEVSRSRTGPLACLPLSLDVLVRHYLATDGFHSDVGDGGTVHVTEPPSAAASCRFRP
jgi:hypothetical protein